jgi:hypothetical protein
MSRDLPPPLAQAFVICRQIYEDARTHEFILIDPLNRLVLPVTPTHVTVSLYGHLSGGRGLYQMHVQLKDSDDEEAWAWTVPTKVDIPDPLEPHQIALYDLSVKIPRPGKYDLILFANGHEIARQSLLVSVAGAVR